MTLAAFWFTLCFIGFTALIWFRLSDTVDQAFNRSSLLFFILISQGNAVVTQSLATFVKERNLLKRERAKKMYGVLSYFLGKTLADMTNSIVFPMIFAIAIYGITNLRPTLVAFFKFLLIFYLSLSNAQSLGVVLSLAISNMQISLKVAPTLVLFLMILGGFYIPFSSMSAFVQKFSWVSFARYGFSAFLINEFGDRTIPCSKDAIECTELNGNDLLSSMGVTGSLFFHIFVMVALQISLRTLAYYMMRHKK